MGHPEFTQIVCAVCGASLSRYELTLRPGEPAVEWTHPPDGRDRGHEPVPALFSPDGPRQWTCDFCVTAPPSCWWQPGRVNPALPKAFAVPGLVTDSSAETPWMACNGCSALVAAADFPGLMRRWRDLAPVPPGTSLQAHRRAGAPEVAAMLRQFLDSGPSGPHPLP